MSVDLSRGPWFKSSYSQGISECMEVAWLPGGEVGVRDSKNPSGPALVFALGEWDAFIARIADGEFHRR
ncbi:DUF397 domain-containing protein [Nocardia uniformis]|uniref:DUF397 domain-containing protein n=1 Tax=Nocardia uniformis TaxID=53432 RepID=A0A849BXQ0_9NOCA|nr:DUF397 domain-containing protein [Nocardia uniformis]